MDGEDDYENNNSTFPAVWFTDPMDLELGQSITLTFEIMHTNCTPTTSPSIIFNSVIDNNSLAQNGPNGTYFPQVCHEISGSFQDILDDDQNFPSIPDQIASCEPFATHVTYYVEDELIIDVDGKYCIYPFNNSTGQFHLGPDASIVVKSGAHLHLSNVKIFACTGMWESIIVADGGELTLDGCDIQDGINAIRAEDGATLNIKNCNFIDNRVGILVPQNIGVVQNITFNNFFNNHFSGGMLGLKAPFLNKKPLAGIVVYDLSLLSIPYIASGSIGSTFENMEYGIRAFRSHLAVDRAKFIDIQPSVGPFQTGGYGILSIGAPSFCVINGFGNDPIFNETMFKNCTVGISSSKNLLICQDVLMKKVKIGITTNQNTFLFNHILDNRIEATNIGIDLFGPSPNVGTIEGNELIMNHPSESAYSYGIRSNGTPFSNPNGWAIENNFFQLLNTRNGISLTSGSNTQVRNNTIFMDDPVLEIYNGISFKGSPNTTVECNFIEGNASIDTDNYKAAIGIYNSGSSNSFIGCNDIDKTNVGINFWDMCTGAELYGNTLKKHQTGLLLGAFPDNGNAFIGEQSLLGNQWPVLNSTDNNGGGDLEGARHLGNTYDIIEFSEFIVDATPEIQYMPSIETPFANNNPQWFQPENGVNYICNFFPCGGYTGLTGENTDKLKEGIATDQLATDGFNAALRYTGARQLYRHLQENPGEISTGSIFDNFVTTESTSTVGQFHDIQVNTETMFELEANEINTLSQSETDIQFNIVEIQKRDSLIANSSNVDQIIIWLNEKGTLLQTLAQVTANWNNQHSQIANTKAIAAAQIATTNDNITAVELYESNEQILNTIYLNTFAIDSIPDSLQLADLEIIANQCPLEGGTTVYRARALVKGSGYDDDVLCNKVNARKDEEKELSSEIFKLFPNPTSGILSLELPQDVMSITITSTLGITIQQWSNLDFSKNWIIQDINLTTGLYYCTVKTISGKQTQAFMVIK